MATIRQRATGNWEVVIRRARLLPRPHYATFDTEAEARAYADRMEVLLDRGQVPAALLAAPPDAPRRVADLVRRYLVSDGAVSALDRGLLASLDPKVEELSVASLGIAWASSWVRDLKREHRLAPGTIRKRVGALARCLDWHVRHETLPANPLRQLPRGYAAYAPADGPRREDVERDRRLAPAEEVRIRRVLARDPDYIREIGRERPIDEWDAPAWCLLFDLALETAMRLREMYTLSVDQVDVARRTVFLDETKNGDKRQVPLSSVAASCLEAYLSTLDGHQVFPWWDSRSESLARTTSRLSSKWRRIVDLAACPDLHFHDLRGEAICRFYERTSLTDIQISKITGHRDPRMLRKYSNLRGSDLAIKLW